MVVDHEQPPSLAVAKENWPSVQARFLALKQEVEAELQALEAMRRLAVELREPRQALRRKEVELTELQVELKTLEDEVDALRMARDKVSARHESASVAWRQHRTLRPGLIARIRRTSDAKAWAEEDAVWQEPVQRGAEQLALAENTLKERTQARSLIKARYSVFTMKIEAERMEFAERSKVIERYRGEPGSRLIDEDTFLAGHAEWNTTVPWVTEELTRKREALFAEALAVHRAFIDAAATRVFHNLGALHAIGSFGMNEARRKLLGDLWSTLFLVVPVLSTTFASVERMLADVPPETLGWLLIDEAGQATPQAAVGAMLRAKRSIVVGDPLQIPPVVTLPEQLSRGICDVFNVDQPEWTAPSASAQTLTDHASRYQASFQTAAGERRVGLPLLVHRRCQEPMFSISNKIAYADQMVHAVSNRKTEVAAILGGSAWFDVHGEVESKWSPAEGRVVVNMLERLATLPNPDVFVISPFRAVIEEMRSLLESQPELLRRLGPDKKTWLKDRVGTVHTVQGREAEAVILVLGAPAQIHRRAREWAAETPNIFNVAASRAKQNLYVVGSYSAWETVGLTHYVTDHLPRVSASA